MVCYEVKSSTGTQVSNIDQQSDTSHFSINTPLFHTSAKQYRHRQLRIDITILK